jgi:Tfp pilus assembly protein PilN
MSRRFPNRPQSVLSARRGVERRGGPVERLVLGERVILSRALCHFETMNALPGGQSLRRYEAAKLNARARTPIADPEFYFDWGTDQVGVWSWPKSLTSDLTDFEGEILPETVLHSPLQDGARLMKAIDGYEGQVWRDGQLRASRWWPNQPGDADWANFMRVSRMTGVDQFRPAVEELVLTDRPAHDQPYTALLDRVKSINLRDMAALALLCIAVPGLYLLGQWAHLSQTRASANAELSALSVETAEISEARRSAQTASNELAAYASALNRRHPAELLASVSEELARFSIRLDAFEQNDDQLALNLRADADFAPEALVRAMENNPLMNSVRLEPGRGNGEWLLTAQLEALQ